MKVRQLPDPSSAPSFGISAYLHMKSQKLTIEFFAGLFTPNILAVTRPFVNQNPLLCAECLNSKPATRNPEQVFFDSDQTELPPPDVYYLSGAVTNIQEISPKEKSDIRTLLRFVAVYCREKHEGAKAPFFLKQLDNEQIEKKPVLLCRECKRLLAYGINMRLKCPHDPKPMCKKCESQCYKGEYKAKIREIMKFSGMHLVKRGRVHLLYHYFK